MLSNFWIEPFEYDGLKWNTAEHYYQASKFKKNNPDFYKMFSLDSESSFNQDPIRAKAAGDKTGKLKSEQIRPKNIKVDSDFFENKNSEKQMYLAQFYKFNNSNAKYLKDMLSKTKDAKLLHMMPRSTEREFYENLVAIRYLIHNGNI